MELPKNVGELKTLIQESYTNPASRKNLVYYLALVYLDVSEKHPSFSFLLASTQYLPFDDFVGKLEKLLERLASDMEAEKYWFSLHSLISELASLSRLSLDKIIFSAMLVGNLTPETVGPAAEEKFKTINEKSI